MRMVGIPRMRPGTISDPSGEPKLLTIGGSMSAGPVEASTETAEPPDNVPGLGLAPPPGDTPGLAPATAADGLGDGDGAALPAGRLGVGIDSVAVGTGSVGVGGTSVGRGGSVGSGGSVGGLIVGSGKGGAVGNRTVGTGSGGSVCNGTLGSAMGKDGSDSPRAEAGRATNNTAPMAAVTTRTLTPWLATFRGGVARFTRP
jgi:hypothetical protein